MFIIDYIKQWKKQWEERCKRKSILKDIKKAKDIYIRHESDYMCFCFFNVDSEKYWNPVKIRERIPEFNREFLGAKMPYGNGIWWEDDDRNSRIKAFDKLIEIYSRN